MKERSGLGGKARAKALGAEQREQISRAGGLARMAGMSASRAQRPRPPGSRKSVV